MRAVLAVCGVLVALAGRADAASYAARVERVFDGDTVWVRPIDRAARGRKLRLDGIDAPEICQRGGPQARDALSARVLRQVVRVHERASDHWGRRLARLEHQSDDVNGWMVRSGHAWSHRWRGQGPYDAAQSRARARRLGVFADPAAQAPRDFRRAHGPCAPPGARASAAR